MYKRNLFFILAYTKYNQKHKSWQLTEVESGQQLEF